MGNVLLEQRYVSRLFPFRAICGLLVGSLEADVSAYVTDLIWLSTSSAVDLVLSMVLSLELWWARRKLAAKGGIMAKVTWQLLVCLEISSSRE